MPGIIGRKIGMTSVFGTEGENIACTVIQAGPCVVTQVKNAESDGYRAIQLSYGDKKEKHSNKPETGHFKKANTTPKKAVVPTAYHSSVSGKHTTPFPHGSTNCFAHA